MKHLFFFISFFITLFLLFLLYDKLYPINTDRLYREQSKQIFSDVNETLCVTLSKDGYWRLPIQNIPKRVKTLTLAYEDRYFYYHFGVNPFSLLRALFFNLRNENRIGASTITMQVARMLHRKKRTLKNKFFEILKALQLEFHYTKEEILLLYLSLAPYGGNIEGIESASFFYYRQPLSTLSDAQIAYLISIPKNPNQNRPLDLSKVNELKNRTLERFSYLFESNELNRSKKEWITPIYQSFISPTPHLCNTVKEYRTYYSSINLALQNHLSLLIKEKSRKLTEKGVFNAAGIVIDNQTKQILAYIGSQDFNDKNHSGENDGIASPLSPGSTLKPFIYAKAFENGLTSMNKRLFDIDIYVNGYKPKNYYNDFMGEISTKEALQYSLNIPAVALNASLKENSLYELLQKAQIESIQHKKSFYGSSIALGGASLTLKEIADLYSTLATKGVYRPSTLEINNEKNISLLSEASVYLIAEILRETPRMQMNAEWKFLKKMPTVAFKTGTSARSKDLLSVGYTPEYTVAIWFGNFDRKKGEKLTGLQAASPVVLETLRFLRPKEWFNKPSTLIEKKICIDAFEKNSCQNHQRDLLIKGVDYSFHCTNLRPETLTYLLSKKRITSSELATHKCYNQWQNYKPVIVSPLHNHTYVMNGLLPPNYLKNELKCYTFQKDQTIYWLIDKKVPLKEVSGKSLFIHLTKGEHSIGCLDSASNLDEITTNLKYK